MSKFSNWLKNYLFEEEGQQPIEKANIESDTLIQKVFAEIKEQDDVVEVQQSFDFDQEKIETKPQQEETKVQSSFLNVEKTNNDNKSNIVQPIETKKMTVKSTYIPRTVISPIFGSLDSKPVENNTINNTEVIEPTVVVQKSVIGTIFSPINGKNDVAIRNNITSNNNNDKMNKNGNGSLNKPIINNELINKNQNTQVKQTNQAGNNYSFQNNISNKDNGVLTKNVSSQAFSTNNVPVQNRTFINLPTTNNDSKVASNKTTVQDVRVINPNSFNHSQTNMQLAGSDFLQKPLHINKNYDNSNEIKTESLSDDDSVQQLSLF